MTAMGAVNIADVCGPSWWAALHAVAESIPCESCRKKGVRLLNGVHDVVNVSLGKPIQKPDDLRYLAYMVSQAEEVSVVPTRQYIGNYFQPLWWVSEQWGDALTLSENLQQWFPPNPTIAMKRERQTLIDALPQCSRIETSLIPCPIDSERDCKQKQILCDGRDLIAIRHPSMWTVHDVSIDGEAHETNLVASILKEVGRKATSNLFAQQSYSPCTPEQAKRWDRCVEDLKGRKGVQNPFAVCTSAIGCSHSPKHHNRDDDKFEAEVKVLVDELLKEERGVR